MKKVWKFIEDWIWQLPQNLCGIIYKNAIKNDIIKVITKYIDIDVENCHIEIQHEKGPCLMANIPIKEIKI